MEAKTNARRRAIQSLCRSYLRKLRDLSCRYGLSEWLDAMVAANQREECEATECEVELLSRCVGDDRLSRVEVARTLGLSYRHANDAEVFDDVKKLPRVGIYSRVSTLLYGMLHGKVE